MRTILPGSDVSLVDTVTGFAAFDPDEKNHTLGPVKCDVIIKDVLGDVIAKVPSANA